MRLLHLSLLVAVPAILAGCGSDQRSPSPGPNEVVLTEYRFDPRDVTVKPGSELKVHNDGQIAHDLTLEQPGSGRRLIGTEAFLSGGGGKLRVTLPPGRYKMVCSVPGHEQRGMVGVLRVR
jgi:uncharacterized cupredoxin-like copper-binding protein